MVAKTHGPLFVLRRKRRSIGGGSEEGALCCRTPGRSGGRFVVRGYGREGEYVTGVRDGGEWQIQERGGCGCSSGAVVSDKAAAEPNSGALCRGGATAAATYSGYGGERQSASLRERSLATFGAEGAG